MNLHKLKTRKYILQFSEFVYPNKVDHIEVYGATICSGKVNYMFCTEKYIIKNNLSYKNCGQ